MRLNSDLIDDLKYNLSITSIDKRYIWIKGLYERLKYRTELSIAFDNLQGPTVDSLLSLDEMEQIEKLTKNGKLDFNQKFQILDSIFKPKGYKRGHCGTNRVVYVPYWDDSFVVKVALDRAAKTNMPNEIVNQKYLKPFVCKCFDIDFYGNIGVYERVIPILNLDQFWEIREDVYKIIQKLIRRFVIDDFGTKVFKNWGVRKGFGPVLLDYADMYLIDPNELYCRNYICTHNDKPVYCGGEISYDPGYNTLICTKCGKPAKAAEFKGKPKISFRMKTRKKEKRMAIKWYDENGELEFDSSDPSVAKEYKRKHNIQEEDMDKDTKIIQNMLLETNKEIDRMNNLIYQHSGLPLSNTKAYISKIDPEKISSSTEEYKPITTIILNRNHTELKQYEEKRKSKEKPQTMQNTDIKPKKKKKIIFTDEPSNTANNIPTETVIKKQPSSSKKMKISLNLDNNTNINKEIKEKEKDNKMEKIKMSLKHNLSDFLFEQTKGDPFSKDELVELLNGFDVTEIEGTKKIKDIVPIAFLFNIDPDTEIDNNKLNNIIDDITNIKSEILEFIKFEEEGELYDSNNLRL